MDLIMNLGILLFVETLFLILVIMADKTAVMNGLKVLVGKGKSRILFFGKDGTMLWKVIKTSGKKGSVEEFKDGNKTYKIDTNKLFLYNNRPAFAYKEGTVEPIDPREIQSIQGMDGVFITSLVEKARATAQAPLGDKNNRDDLMFYGILASAGASIVALLFLVKLVGV